MKKITILLLLYLSLSFVWGDRVTRDGWYNTSILTNGITQEFPNRQIKIGTPIDTVNLPAQVNLYKQERAMASVVIHSFPTPIGTTGAGHLTNTMKMVISPDFTLKTAYPY